MKRIIFFTAMIVVGLIIFSCELIVSVPVDNVLVSDKGMQTLYRIFGEEFIDDNIDKVFYVEKIARSAPTAIAAYEWVFDEIYIREVIYRKYTEILLIAVLAHEFHHMFYYKEMGRTFDLIAPANLEELYEIPEDLTVEYHYETMATIIQAIAYMLYAEEYEPDRKRSDLQRLDEYVQYANSFCGLSIAY